MRQEKSRNAVSIVHGQDHLDRVPVQVQFTRHVLYRELSAALADKHRKALRVERVVREEVEPLALHAATAPTAYAPHFDVQVNARIGAGEIAYPAHLAVVPAGVDSSADAAVGFFERRTRVMTRALGSPNTPLIVSCGRNPGNRYASSNRFRFRLRGIAIGNTSRFDERDQTLETPCLQGSRTRYAAISTHTITRRAFFLGLIAVSFQGVCRVRALIRVPCGRFAGRHSDSILSTGSRSTSMASNDSVHASIRRATQRSALSHGTWASA